MENLHTPFLLQIAAWLGLGSKQGPQPARLPRAVETAHAEIAALKRIDDKTCRDAGMSAGDLTGVGTWQPDLPFFMQAGFDR